MTEVINTATSKIDIADASEAQLADFLTTFLQVEVDRTKVDTAAKLRAQITKAGWSAEHIFVQAAASEPATAKEQVKSPRVEGKVLTTRYEDDPQVELRIGSTGYPGGEHPASPCHNGTMLVIQRNMLVKVPYRFYLVLKDSFEDQTRADSKGHPVVTRVTNFPLFDVKLPPQEEIDAWFERTKDVVGA